MGSLMAAYRRASSDRSHRSEIASVRAELDELRTVLVEKKAISQADVTRTKDAGRP